MQMNHHIGPIINADSKMKMRVCLYKHPQASLKGGRVIPFIGICTCSLINLTYAEPKIQTFRLGS